MHPLLCAALSQSNSFDLHALEAHKILNQCKNLLFYQPSPVLDFIEMIEGK